MAAISTCTEESWETTDIIICGGGPTGAMLSALLGQMSIPNIVLEKDAEVSQDPRAIAMDEDAIRLLQKLRLYSQVFTKFGSPGGLFKFIGGVHQDLSRKPFIALDYNTTEGGTGHVYFVSQKQPVTEKAMREVIDQCSSSQLRSESTVTSIYEDEKAVYVEYVDALRTTKRLRGRFLVGADGKTGFTRKKYLEPKGIKLERCLGMTYEEVWVAINAHISLATPESHPNFPLWALGHSPESAYDLFFPKDFRFLCNTSRSAVCGRFGLPIDHLWRFEFVVQKGEDGTDMARSENIARIVHPYLTHPGSRYGINFPVEYPTDCIKILRSRPFTFSARSCNKWALDRVMLVGDAAHVFPPFGGQGITSGFRDAAALAWRLALLCRNPESRQPALDYKRILEGWYSERKQQLERSLAATVENGAYVTEKNPTKATIRDWYLWGLQLVPGWKRWLEKGARRDGMARYDHRPGMAFLPTMGGGGGFPQVYCCPLRERGKRCEKPEVKFTDDVIFASHKKGLFQLAVLLNNTEEIKEDAEAIKDAGQLSGGYIVAQEATYIIHDPSTDVGKSRSMTESQTVVRIATGEEFATADGLCDGRPEPKYYDMFRMQQESSGRKFVIVRPDFFVFAAAFDGAQARTALSAMPTVLEHSGFVTQ